MSDTAVKMAVDRFLKQVTFTAQREMEKVVSGALANGKLHPGKAFNAAISLSSDKLDLDVTIFGKVEL